ncbi:MAG: hypothetical protein ACR2RE_23105, partial [Geminicoccaceae bacterium]
MKIGLTGGPFLFELWTLLMMIGMPASHRPSAKARLLWIQWMNAGRSGLVQTIGAIRTRRMLIQKSPCSQTA